MKVPALESVFLSRTSPSERGDYRRVLVAGGDRTGREVSLVLLGEGYEVILVEDGPSPEELPGVRVVSEAFVKAVEGFVGAFNVIVNTPEGPNAENVDFIVAACPGRNIPKFGLYGLAESRRVVSPAAFEADRRSGAPLIQQRGERFHAVFLCGLEGEADEALFSSVLDGVECLRKQPGVLTYVFMRDAKVAAHGLERRYREAREAGTLFFKFDGPGPVFEEDSEGPVIVFVDPLLGLEMEIAPDLVVVDEQQRPSESLNPILDAIPSSRHFRPFLQPESTRFTGVETPKIGIYAVGPSRGNFLPSGVARDSASVAAAIAAAANNRFRRPGIQPPVVDQATCTVCLTCVRLCPHGAMTFRKRAEADPRSCVRCGICAAECPERAISLPHPEGEADLFTMLANGLAVASGSTKIAAFLCSRSAATAMEYAGPRISGNLVPVIVPCAGTVDVEHILAAFQSNADGVIVAGCHHGNCASLYGSLLAGERAVRAKAMLGEAGLDPDRLLFTTLAANTPSDFVRAVREMERRIGRVAP